MNDSRAFTSRLGKEKKVMSKSVRTVFLIIGTLVACFIAWQLIFNDGGILKTAYNNIATGINGQWEKAAGAGQVILPEWTDSNAADNGTGFEIDTEA